ncbi:hypothetical protein BGZ61DRAFT_491974 [Ilyonectria robusta]|uniref:uncharacterized protein n=1 Tax=Ilyonectria robusta TaxID=1079257 RepID=UPI001E8D3265|nr:uncharacterized protein BGZ61DRAFT_491974 [Ilyonectria robusta]KAH8729769.1 hypothetical protein BGZ61DRAFT_491974 [Ilyonectria robusta]
MAPVNASAKPRRHGGSKLAQPAKPVVPAIPLPHVKRQAAAAAAASASANPSPPATLRSDTKLTNGSATAKTKKEAKKDAKAAVAAATAAAVRPAVKLANDSQPANGPETNDGAVDANHRDSPGTYHVYDGCLLPSQTNKQMLAFLADTSPALIVASVPEPASPLSKQDDTAKATATPDRLDQPATAPNVTVRAQALADTSDKPNGVATKNEMKPHPGEATRSGERRSSMRVSTLPDHPIAKHPTKARPPPAVSPSRYQMPPSFQPANRPLAMAANGDMPRAHRPHVPNGPLMHQPHPSNGSIHFGTFHGSTRDSSPAPPHSGGIAPPPGMPGPDGRPPYMGHGANGFPPMMPYGADMGPVTTFDNYGRPSMGYPPMDSYPGYGNNFGPSTPHSFHDSQTSGHPEDGMYGQYQPGPVRNGAPGHGEDSPNHPGRMFGGPEYPRMMPNHGPPPHMMPPTDEADGLVGHLQQQFGMPEFADCILELRYMDDRAPPVRIPGHRILLTRSIELAGLLAKQPQTSPELPSLPTVHLETKSKWIRSDTFYLAAQRLYGLPLFSVPPPPAGVKQGDVADAGSAIERLDFSLSYAAAGHLLSWEPVVRRGCEIAIQLINWQTMERALEFALEDHIDMGSHDTYKYGDGSRAILNETVNFIINNLPPNFILDTSIAEPEYLRRLPSYPTPPATPMAQKHSPPAIARGTSLHLNRNRRSQQVTGIQFGDLSMSDGKNSATGNREASQLPPPPSHAIISRVLLNLPFTLLKMALESSGSNNVNGWTNPEHRHRILKDVVTERERRRLLAVDAIRDGRVAGWESIWKQLSTPEPRYFDQRIAPLGWLEEILPYGNPEGPTLARMWIPLKEPQNGTRAEYP